MAETSTADWILGAGIFLAGQAVTLLGIYLQNRAKHQRDREAREEGRADRRNEQQRETLIQLQSAMSEDLGTLTEIAMKALETNHRLKTWPGFPYETAMLRGRETRRRAEDLKELVLDAEIRELHRSRQDASGRVMMSRNADELIHRYHDLLQADLNFQTRLGTILRELL